MDGRISCQGPERVFNAEDGLFAREVGRRLTARSRADAPISSARLVCVRGGAPLNANVRRSECSLELWKRWTLVLETCNGDQRWSA